MKPLSFTKVALQKFAELKNPKGVQFMAARTTQTSMNLLIARDGDSEVMLAVDDDNLRQFALEILRGPERARH